MQLIPIMHRAHRTVWTRPRVNSRPVYEMLNSIIPKSKAHIHSRGTKPYHAPASMSQTRVQWNMLLLTKNSPKHTDTRVHKEVYLQDHRNEHKRHAKCTTTPVCRQTRRKQDQRRRRRRRRSQRRRHEQLRRSTIQRRTEVRWRERASTIPTDRWWRHSIRRRRGQDRARTDHTTATNRLVHSVY